MNTSRLLVIACLILALSAASARAAQPSADAPSGDYAVVVSRKTAENADWKPVVDALVRKHRATVITYADQVSETRAALAKLFPKFVCFVAQPEDAGRNFVVAVHRLTRALDDDPYPDVFWGIITGYDAADALRIASFDKPLLITRGAGGTSIDLDAFEQGIWFSEGEKGAKFVKMPDSSGKEKCKDDSTGEIAEMLNTFKPQIFITSGHATFRDWQIGYSYPNGQLRCRDGKLFGVGLDKRTYPIDSPEPKIYLPCGNCLIGLIPDRQAMALAWMHSGGAYQFCGYTVSTFFGYGGWGVRDYFFANPGHFSYNQAFGANSIALIHQLETRFPKNARANLDDYDIERDPGKINRIARQLKVTHRDELGLLWDRDTVAFYGDPAWDARLKAIRPAKWTETLTAKEGTWTLTITANADLENWGSRPLVHFLPQRVTNAKLVQGMEYQPLVADSFVLVEKPIPLKKGESATIAFTSGAADLGK